LESQPWWTVRSRSGECNEATAWHGHIADAGYTDENGAELDDLGSCCCEDIDGARIRMRMRTLHVHNAFIFRRFKFRQMCVYCRRLARVRVHVEKRSVKHRQKKRRYCAASRQSPHGCILMN
jgi:hypothetical protein